MTRTIRLTALFSILLALPLSLAAERGGPTPQTRAAMDAFGHLPLSFMANQGQADPRIGFLTNCNGYSIALGRDRAEMTLRPNARTPGSTNALSMRLLNAADHTRVSAENELPGKTNFLTGKDKSAWHENIPAYSRVRYGAVYPGVDMLFYGNRQQLEFDFVVQPGADANTIRLDFAGSVEGKTVALKISASGDLVDRETERLLLHKPTLYQPMSSRATGKARRSVEGKFVLTNTHEVRFSVGKYNRRLPLVIDPTLSYSTFIGGVGSDQTVLGVAVDAAGDSYITGFAVFNGFPVTSGAFETTTPPNVATFVTKFNATGTALLYSTYLSGSQGNTQPAGIAVDAEGNAYIAGTTSDVDFPTTAGAFERQGSVFVTKLNPAGSALVYSTFVNGSAASRGVSGIALDAENSAYITGVTNANGFPTTPGAFRSTSTTGSYGYVTKLNSAGSALEYSALLGDGAPAGIAVTPDGEAFITGYAATPTTFYTTPGAFSRAGTAFVTKFNKTGTGVAYSTLLAGTQFSRSIAVDAAGEAYVAGSTSARDLPTTPGAFQTTCNACLDAFVTKLNTSGSSLLYSTYVGNSAPPDQLGQGGTTSVANSIAVDPQGNAYVTGFTNDAKFPVTPDAFQSTFRDTDPDESSDAFLSQLNSQGSALLYSTFFGGSGEDIGNSISVDATGNAYVAGTAKHSQAFPLTSGAYQVADTAGGAEVFVSKFSFAAPFCSFRAALEASIDRHRENSFLLDAVFSSENKVAIDPTIQPVSITVGAYTVTVPAGEFRAHGAGYFYRGSIQGVTLDLILRQLRPDGDDVRGWRRRPPSGPSCSAAAYSLIGFGRGAILSGLSNPVSVTVSVGTNTGTERVRARFEP